MPPEPRKYIWDALQARERIGRFVEGKGFEDYWRDELLKSAVERQFEIIGEALGQLNKTAPGTATMIPDIRRIVAFRKSSCTVTHRSTIVSYGASSRLACRRSWQS